MIDLTSVINVTRDSSFNEWLCVFNNPSKMDLAERIWCSHTLPIWEAPGGLVYHTIQSAPFSYRKVFIFSCFISFNALFNSLLATEFEPTKFESLSDHIERTSLLLDMNLRKARMKESASSVLVTSMCTKRLEKKFKRAT